MNSPSQREASGCLSCSVHGVGSSNYDRGYSTAIYGTGSHSYPQSTSSRQEFRSEQQFENGKPVYRLEHERSFKDGRLVHDRRVEEDEDDLGYSASAGTGGYHRSQSSLTRSSSTNIGGYDQGSHYPQSSSHTSNYQGSSSQESFSSDMQDRLRQMQEDLRWRMMSPHQPMHGGSHRSEHHSEVRFIDGQPVFKKEKELSYRDGQLVMNRTEEEGPDDLGTEDVVRRYDSSGALITDSSSRGYYGSNQRHDGHYSPSAHTPHTGYTYTASYPSYSSWQSWSSWSSSGYPASPSYPSSSSQVSNRHREETSRSSSSYPSYTPRSPSSTYREEEDRYSSSYPSYNPTSGISSTSNREDHSQYSSSYPSPGPSQGSYPREEDDDDHYSSSLHPSYRPTSSRVSTTYREEDHRHSSSYPSSTTYREEQDRHSSLYGSVSSGPSTTVRPASSSSSTFDSPSTSYRGVGDQHYSSYPTQRTPSRSSSTSYRREESQNSFSYPYHRSGPSSSTPSSRDVLPVHQGVTPPSVGTRTYHHTPGHSVRGESEEEHIQGPIGGHREHYYREYEQRRNDERRSSSPRPAVLGTSSGGARTVTFDLSSSSSNSGSSLTDHLLQPNNSGRRHDTWDEDQQREDGDYEPHEERVGIPGVISGPPPSSIDDVDHRDDDDGDDSHRYDISPHIDGFVPTLPTVDNEVESAPIPVPNSREEDTGSTEVHGDDDDESPDDRRLFSSGSITTTFNYRNSHNREDARGTGHSTTRHSDRHGSQINTHDESHPVVGSSRYHYNESSTRTSMTRGHQQQGAIPGHPHSIPCTQPGGCVIPGISRRTETRTMRRYVNGQLVGVTVYERQFENGVLVHEDRKDYDRDEALRLGLGELDNSRMNLTHDTYHPESYSQQHEVRTEKKFVNGQQVHEVNHERRYEDGALVFDNLVEKDEDDFEQERHHIGGGDARQQVTHTQHQHRQDASGQEVTGVLTRDPHGHPVSELT